MTVQTTGYNSNTAKHLLLDAGAVYKNFDIATMTGTLLGATQGGNEFSAQPNMRKIEIDGVKGDAKGLSVVDNWEVRLTTNILEMTADNIATALATGQIDTTTNDTFDIITAKNDISVSDYIDNIAFVGRLTGSSNPVIIIVKNAVNTDGLSFAAEDSGEAVMQVTFTGHYDADDLDTPPFEIYYPKITGDVTAPTA
jgi:hypothetical protein